MKEVMTKASSLRRLQVGAGQGIITGAWEERSMKSEAVMYLCTAIVNASQIHKSTTFHQSLQPPHLTHQSRRNPGC